MKKYFEIMNDLLIKNEGIISRKEVMNLGISSSYFSKFIKDNNLNKIKKGEYVNDDYLIDNYFLLQKKYPNIVFSGYSALYLHNLIDQIPAYLEFTILKGSRVRKNSSEERMVIHIENNENIFKYGNCYVIDEFGNRIFTYSKEKAIVEMIRKRNQYDSESYLKALKNFLKCKDKSFELLFEYARLRKIEDKVYDIFELLAYES